MLIPLMKKMCSSCPFRKGSQYQYLVGDLAASALSEGSRICHSTGENGLRGQTGRLDRLCRGARDIQLDVFAAMGVINAPTDEAWARKWQEVSSKGAKESCK